MRLEDIEEINKSSFTQKVKVNKEAVEEEWSKFIGWDEDEDSISTLENVVCPYKIESIPVFDYMSGSYNYDELQESVDVVISTKDLPFEDLEPNLKTWEDTASYMSSMDLIITSCTSTAHMSAALGIETWVIVPVLPYYLWAVPKNKSAWYDSVTLFRQEIYGNWDAPLKAIEEALKQKTKLKVAA